MLAINKMMAGRLASAEIQSTEWTSSSAFGRHFVLINRYTQEHSQISALLVFASAKSPAGYLFEIEGAYVPTQ